MSAGEPFWWYAQQINGIQWASQDPLTGNLFNPAATAAGGCSGITTIAPLAPVLPEEPQVPMTRYLESLKLWSDVYHENMHLKQRIAELEAQLTQE